MACSNESRQRPRNVAFRVSNEEFVKINQRVAVSGEVKGDYLRAMALEGEINIFVGKYKSDKLALELRKLQRSMDEALVNDDLESYGEELRAVKILLVELKDVIESSIPEKIK